MADSVQAGPPGKYISMCIAKCFVFMLSVFIMSTLCMYSSSLFVSCILVVLHLFVFQYVH